MKNKLDKILEEKFAYPNNDQYFFIPGQHDTKKWLEAIKNIYYKEKNGIDKKLAIRQATSNWDIVETRDFLNWLKFYEEGAHLKYKFAQLWYANDSPGYFLPIKKDPEVVVEETQTIDDVKNSVENDIDREEGIKRLRRKMMGRLDSLEKLLRLDEGKYLSDKEFEKLTDAIYNLKRQISLINKTTLSSTIYDDIIIRQANILAKGGFFKASDLLYSLANGSGVTPPPNNTPPPPVVQDDKPSSVKLPESTPPAPPMQPTGPANTTTSGAPGSPPTINNNSPTKPETKPAAKGIFDFQKGLATGGNVSDLPTIAGDDNDLEDDLEVIDFISEAQEIPEPLPKSNLLPKPAPLLDTIPIEENPLEVKEEDLGEPLEVSDIPKASPIKVDKKEPLVEHSTKDFDNMIDSVFSNISVSDVVSKLEDLAKIYKVREVPRQLSIVDMMLDSLGLASFFPTLSEATNKALESNNYISSRIEDILSRLRGAMKTKDVDLKSEKESKSPEVAAVKNKLREMEDLDKNKKQLRKDIEEQELKEKSKEVPEINLEEGLEEPLTPLPKEKPAPLTPPLPAPKSKF